MIRPLRLAVALAVVLSIGLAAPPTADAFGIRLPFGGKDRTTAQRANAQAVPFPIGVWPHEESDLKPDQQVRFGRLPNGMRYALMKNATPSGQASLRLRFDAGSFWESDAQQGLAHFLEHMAFNGSANVPEGEMTKILERHGLAFGADTNASTSWAETIYKLDLPNTRDETVDTSLMLLRETASNLLIQPEAVERERGVVLSEERSRDTPPFRVFKQRETFFLKDQLAPRRLPIGLETVLREATAAQIRDLYTRLYRPERAVLVAVGDFDVDTMEAKVKARFGDWSAAGRGGPEPDLGRLALRQSEAFVSVQRGAPFTIEFAWLNPARYVPDTRAEERRYLIESLGLAVLNRRLERIARTDQPPFIGAYAGKGDELRSAEVTTLSLRVEPERWKAALAAAEHEQRRLVQYGVRQDELDREIQEWRTRLQANAAAAATRRTPSLANGLINAIGGREVTVSPAQELELFDAEVRDLKVEPVNAAMKAAFAGQGPLLFVSTSDPLEGDAAAVMAAFEQARATSVDAPVAEAIKPWPYASFGPAGAVVEQKDVPDLDAVFVRYANGVKLTVKPTRFRDDQVLVSVRVGNGRQTLTPGAHNTAWLAGSVFSESALKQLTMEELERIMASRIVGASLAIGEDAYVLSGGTRPEDLDVQMQLLAAYLTEPGYRGEVFARWRSLGPTLHDQYAATPGGVLRRDLPALLRSGDRRWTFPSRQEIAGSSLEELKALLTEVGPQGAVEVTVVGDTTVERAIASVGATFGALKLSPAPAAEIKPIVFPKDGSPVILTHTGRADQGLGYIAWPADDFFADVARSRAARMVGYVLQLRLTDQLRETQGAAYSPSADSTASYVFPRYGFIAASVEMPPEKLDGFFRDVEAIAADLRDKPVSADELQRAKDPRVQALEKARESNEYWLDALAGAQEDPRRLDAVRSAVSGLERVTAAEVQAAARLYLVPAAAFRLKIIPEKR
jgi:zinc protease